MQKFANKTKLSGGRKSAKKGLRKSLRKIRKSLRKSLRKIRKSLRNSLRRNATAKTTTHPYYKMIDAAKAWHVAHVDGTDPDQNNWGSVLSWEDEARIRNGWPGMRGRYTLKDAKAIVDLDEIGFSSMPHGASNKEALFKKPDYKDMEKPEELVNYQFFGEENGSYIFAMPVPVGFTPSTAHTCAEELRKYVATRFGLDITTVNILYYTIQTFDTAMFGDDAMTSIDGTKRYIPFSQLSNDDEDFPYVAELPVRPGTDKTTSGLEHVSRKDLQKILSFGQPPNPVV